MTHTSRANEDVSGGVVDNESLEFLGDAVLGFVDRRHAVPRVSGLRRGREVEDEGVARLDGHARAAGRAAAPGRSPAARARRGEDRRTPQAGAARGRLRGAHRGDLSRRRHRAGARVHRARVRVRCSTRRAGTASRRRITSRRCRSCVQARSQPLPEYRLVGTLGPDHASCSRWRCWSAASRWPGRAGASKKEAEQEAARARAQIEFQ